MDARLGVWLYRRTDGRALRGSGASSVLLLTTPGRRSGEPRSACVASLRDGDAYVVWGTGAGAPRDPDWFRNLRAAGATTVQEGGREFPATVRELTGAERDARWAEIVASVPGVSRYAAKAGRTIPVAILTPLAG
ncbi:nitroreductase/quinone reductase family protein [Microbacter sp. GSS18]|nr:nitroreductase/quinone reductase family protein [Microbacter sp. GSS18]